MTGHWWYYSYCALRELIRVDATATKEILCTNLSVIAGQLNKVSTYDMEKSHCLKFMKLLHDFDLTIFDTLVQQIDILKLKDSWDKSYSAYATEKVRADRRSLCMRSG